MNFYVLSIVKLGLATTKNVNSLRSSFGFHFWSCFMICATLCVFIVFTSFRLAKKRALKHHHNELYSQITRIYICRNVFRVLSKEISKNISFSYCLTGCYKQKCRLPRGDPKRGNPTMTTSTVTARRKGNPQHYAKGIGNFGNQIGETCWNYAQCMPDSCPSHPRQLSRTRPLVT